MMRQIALLLSLTVCLAAYGQEPADQEEQAVSAILKLGGKVERDENLPGRPVVGVDLRITNITDSDLKNLKGLKGLQVLDLSRNEITDAGLKNLQELKGLQMLRLSATPITAAGLKDLKQALPETILTGP